MGYNEDLKIFANFPQVLIEGNFLIGKFFITNHNNIRVTSGLSLIKGVERGKNISSGGFGFNSLGSLSSSYKRIEFIGIGFPIEIMVTFGPSNIFGIGISTNINNYIPYIMANLSYRIFKF